MLGAISLKLIIHYNPCLWRRFYSISMNLSRVFSKKITWIFLLGLGGKLEGRFKICYKQILNHVEFFCNSFFHIFLTYFLKKCNTFFQIFLTYFLKKCKKFFNFFTLKCCINVTYNNWLLPRKNSYYI